MAIEADGIDWMMVGKVFYSYIYSGNNGRNNSPIDNCGHWAVDDGVCSNTVVTTLGSVCSGDFGDSNFREDGGNYCS